MELPEPIYALPRQHQPVAARVLLEPRPEGRPGDPLREMRLTLRETVRGPVQGGVQPIVLHTERGEMVGRLHPVDRAGQRPSRAVIWVGGAGGGLDGPARGLYPAACERLQQKGIAGLRLHYRRPNELADCILDVLLAVAFLRSEGSSALPSSATASAARW